MERDPEWKGLLPSWDVAPELPMILSIAISVVALASDWSTGEKLAAAVLALLSAGWGIVLWALLDTDVPSEDPA